MRVPALPLSRLRWQVSSGVEVGVRTSPEETAVAIVHDGSTTAVMMATPSDLEDFGLGFTLSEGLVDTLDDVRHLEIVDDEHGVEVRLWLAAKPSAALARRRRLLVGATGCGLCGVESLAEAAKPARQIEIEGVSVPAEALLAAMDSLTAAQPLGAVTRAMHAAALWRPGAPLMVREDVGRHNALDKLIGANAKTGAAAGDGALLLTSRVSVEMVQKAAVLGTPILCAVSAPTALAVRMAEACGLTLVGVARADGFEVFTHPQRIDFPTSR